MALVQRLSRMRLARWPAPGLHSPGGRVIPGPCSRTAGFTLVELIVVIIVMGILAVVALPRLDLLSGFDEAAYRDKVKSALQYARRSAVAQRRVVCVTVAGSEVILEVEKTQPEDSGGSCASPQDLNLPTTDSRCSGGAANRVCPPDDVGLADASLGFDALGRPLDGSGNVLTNDTVWTVSNTSTGSTTTLTVFAESGYVY